MKDLWELDLTSLAWSEVIANGPNPSARHSMGFVGVSQVNILLFGGRNEAGLSTSVVPLLQNFDCP